MDIKVEGNQIINEYGVAAHAVQTRHSFHRLYETAYNPFIVPTILERNFDDTMRLKGRAYNYPNESDGSLITTSPIEHVLFADGSVQEVQPHAEIRVTPDGYGLIDNQGFRVTEIRMNGSMVELTASGVNPHLLSPTLMADRGKLIALGTMVNHPTHAGIVLEPIELLVLDDGTCVRPVVSHKARGMLASVSGYRTYPAWNLVAKAHCALAGLRL